MSMSFMQKKVKIYLENEIKRITTTTTTIPIYKNTKFMIYTNNNTILSPLIVGLLWVINDEKSEINEYPVKHRKISSVFFLLHIFTFTDSLLVCVVYSSK